MSKASRYAVASLPEQERAGAPSFQVVTSYAPPAAESLRSLAIKADDAAFAETSLAARWTELAAGTAKVADAFFTEARCVLVVTSDAAHARAALDRRRRQILESVLAGQPQKVVAMELGLAASTIAVHARVALEKMGLPGRPSHAHPLVMLASSAAAAADDSVIALESSLTYEAVSFQVLSIRRPETCLGALPGAELAVVRGLVEGLSHDAIARARGTSVRTVANQISAVFKRLAVSGRNQLVARLLREDGRGGTPPPSASPTPARSLVLAC
ncbi:MAG TPA: LuxR C-terminal-related transcriptional regulator [Polyangiaceae bacterium]|jgi:DNA-binding NarL/FixJ family response regulator